LSDRNGRGVSSKKKKEGTKGEGTKLFGEGPVEKRKNCKVLRYSSDNPAAIGADRVRTLVKRRGEKTIEGTKNGESREKKLRGGDPQQGPKSVLRRRKT